MTSNCFYLQPFKWEENVERVTDSKAQIIHCWAKAIPASQDGTPDSKEGPTTYLFRVKNYPYRVTLILPAEANLKTKNVPVTENDVKTIRSYFETWVTSYHGMVCLSRDDYQNFKSDKERLETHFVETYSQEYSPKKITYEKRRRVYYYKRSSDRELTTGGNKFPEREEWVMHLDFVNKDAAMKFAGSGPGCYMSGEYIDGKRNKPFVKQIYGKSYKFDVGFKGIESVQKLLTERKVSRCGWFFVRDATPAKPAERISLPTGSKLWVTETGRELSIESGVPEYFIESVSIIPPDANIVRNLQSVPSIVSWDIECYSDNHKAMPNPWNVKHAAYIITAVYQQYKKPDSRIRRAFVFGNCDYETPTEADGRSTALVKCETELEMIDKFSEFIQEINPDILVGYNIFGFDINYLKTRLDRSARSWNNMGRLKDNITQTGFTDWSSSAYGKNQLYWIESPGRICVDMMKIIERDYKFSDYKLETVSQALLNKGKNDVSPQEMFRIYERCLRNEPGCQAEMLKVVMYGIQDAVLPIELFEKINGWPFLIESSNVMCVNPMDLFTRGQQLRLINQFYDKCFYMGFVIDSRKVNIIEAEGAYVVPPIKGLHHNMMTLDFASLYPSIMIAHNIGHDTFVLDDTIPDEHCHVFEWSDEDEKKINQEGGFEPDREVYDEIQADKEEDGGVMSEYKIQKNKDGKWRFRFIKVEYGHRSIVSTMLVDLLAARKAVRNEQKKVKDSDPIYYEILEQRQKAIKVSCNSAYGMLLAQATGKLPLAEGGVCVTYRGRELNLEMQRLSKERYGAVTVYGDSVTGDTPVLVRDPISGMGYDNIENISSEWEAGYHGDKETGKIPDGLEVWSDKGWTKVHNLIRHRCHKKILRVLTITGCVDVTEDHSLLTKTAEKISPKDCKVGDELLHTNLPPERRELNLLQSEGSVTFTSKFAAANFYLRAGLSKFNAKIEFERERYTLSWGAESVNTNPDAIVKIIDLGYTDDYVYDFTTDNHHFSAGIGRMVVHNTDSIMVKTAYTKLMVEAAHKFPEGYQPSMDEINLIARELGIADYSEEIAGRFLDHYHGFKQEYEVCNEMGEHIAHDIASHLPKPISLEFENVFIDALFLMKKRYACVVLDRDKMVVKRHPNKMYTKGIMLARRDNCQWARDLFRDALYNLLCGKTRQEIALIVHEHIHRLLTWQVPIKELEIIQKLGFDYKSETFPLKLFSEHLQDIGKPAKPNDRIPFIVSSVANRLADPRDPKLGHFYRLAETLREEISNGENSIDYLYYIERLSNDVDQIFSIGFIPEIERENQLRSSRVTDRIDKEISGIEDEMKGLETEIGKLDRKLEKMNESKSKDSVQITKELRAMKKKLKDFDKEREKKQKQKLLLETKGMEAFNRKMNNCELFLDDKFYDHVVTFLGRRREVLKSIKAQDWKLRTWKPESKKKSPVTLHNWFK